MLVITIDLVLDGPVPARRTIASMRIATLGDLADVADYRIEVMEGADGFAGTPARSAYCVVAGHDRRRGVWALLAKAGEEILKAEFDEL